VIRIIRIGAAWAVYWIGEAMYQVGLPYALYSRLFVWTDTLQGDHVGGPWGPVENGK
jgi:hypothetical protein